MAIEIEADGRHLQDRSLSKERGNRDDDAKSNVSSLFVLLSSSVKTWDCLVSDGSGTRSWQSCTYYASIRYM